jgi:hypothetical protein
MSPPEGHIHYGIGKDPEGYYVAVRLECQGKFMDYAIEGWFQDFQEAFSFMQALIDIVETDARARGLSVVSSDSN